MGEDLLSTGSSSLSRRARHTLIDLRAAQLGVSSLRKLSNRVG